MVIANKIRKKPVKYWLIGAPTALILFIVGVSASPTTTTPSQPSQSPTQTPSYSGPAVVYEVTGTAEEVSITLSNATGGTEQCHWYFLVGDKSSSTPWQREYYSFPNYFLYISAQNQGEYGRVTVSIYVDGKLFKTSSSSGAYVIASASGTK